MKFHLPCNDQLLLLREELKSLSESYRKLKFENDKLRSVLEEKGWLPKPSSDDQWKVVGSSGAKLKLTRAVHTSKTIQCTNRYSILQDEMVEGKGHLADVRSQPMGKPTHQGKRL